MIGEISDRAYDLAALTAQPLADVQSSSVPPGGAAVIDLKVEVPGKYMLVDHALDRVERGLVGMLRGGRAATQYLQGLRSGRIGPLDVALTHALSDGAAASGNSREAVCIAGFATGWGLL